MSIGIFCLLAVIFVSCSQNGDTKGVVYSGDANLHGRIRQFTATNADNDKSIILNMTGHRELTFNFNNKITYIDYNQNVIGFRLKNDESEWIAKKVRGGFELGDGKRLEYGTCRNWTICLLDGSTKLPILKGRYSLKGNSATIVLWISKSEEHVELLGLMANGLLRRSRHAKDVNESLSPQMWTY